MEASRQERAPRPRARSLLSGSESDSAVPLRAELESTDQIPPLDVGSRLTKQEVSRTASTTTLASVCEITESSNGSWGRERSLSGTVGVGARRRANSWKSGKLEGIERDLEEEEEVVDPNAGHKLRRGRSTTTIASPILTATPEVEIEEPDCTTSELEAASSFRQFLPHLTYISILFVVSLIIVTLAVASLPMANLLLPRKLAQLPALTTSLSLYRAHSAFAEAHLFAVLSIVYVAQNAWSIPGAILTNILWGAMYGSVWGSLYACLGTATGSTGAYYLGKQAKPLPEVYLPKPLSTLRKASEGPDLFTFLLLARFFPLLPYSILNILSGCLELPLSTFFTTLVLGSFPFNFATVSIGELVVLAASSADGTANGLDQIWSKDVLKKLFMVTAVSVLPLVFKKQIIVFLNSHRLGSIRHAVLNLISPFLPTTSTTSLASPDSSIELLTIDGRPQPAQPPPTSEGIKGEFRRKWNRSWGGTSSGGGHRFERVLVRSTVLGSASLELGDRVRDSKDGTDGFF